jgi:hypothetical protein
MTTTKTTQAKTIDKYFSYYGSSLELITAIDSENSIIFIIVTNQYSFINLIPRYKPDELNIFANHIKIKFIKTIENGSDKIV